MGRAASAGESWGAERAARRGAVRQKRFMRANSHCWIRSHSTSRRRGALRDGWRMEESLAASQQEHEREEHDGDQGEGGVEQGFAAAGQAEAMQGGAANALLDAYLLLVFEVPGHLVGGGVAVAGV